MESVTLKPNQIIKPPVSEDILPGLVKRLYGLKVTSLREMVSYDDRNFHIKVEKEGNEELEDRLEEYTLKFTNFLDTGKTNLLESVVGLELMVNGFGARIKVPVPVQNVHGDYIVRLKANELNSTEKVNGEIGEEERLYAVHLLSFLPGTTMYNVPYTSSVLNQFGQLLADLSFALQAAVTSPVADPLRNRRALWSLYNVLKVKPFLEELKNSNGIETHRLELVETVLANFEKDILLNDFFKELPQILIHGDFNDHNVIVRKGSLGEEEHVVYGVLDFTDCHFAPRIFEVSIAMTYAMIESRLLDPMDAGGHVFAGYQTRTKEIGDVIEPMEEDELNLLKICIEARLTQSLVMGAYTFMLDPSNTYVLSTAERGWAILERLVHQEDTSELRQRWDSILNAYQSDSFLHYHTDKTSF